MIEKIEEFSGFLMKPETILAFLKLLNQALETTPIFEKEEA